jgi:hypothetical protein
MARARLKARPHSGRTRFGHSAETVGCANTGRRAASGRHDAPVGAGLAGGQSRAGLGLAAAIGQRHPGLNRLCPNAGSLFSEAGATSGPCPDAARSGTVHTAARATASLVSTARDVRAAVAGDCTGAAMAGKMMQRLGRAVRCCPHARSIFSCSGAPESAGERRKHHHDTPPKANRASRNVLNQGTTTSGCTIMDAMKRVNRHVCAAPTRTREQAQVFRRQALLFSPAGSSRSGSGDRPGGRSGREARGRRGLWATDGQGTATLWS